MNTHTHTHINHSLDVSNVGNESYIKYELTGLMTPMAVGYHEARGRAGRDGHEGRPILSAARAEAEECTGMKDEEKKNTPAGVPKGQFKAPLLFYHGDDSLAAELEDRDREGSAEG